MRSIISVASPLVHCDLRVFGVVIRVPRPKERRSGVSLSEAQHAVVVERMNARVPVAQIAQDMNTSSQTGGLTDPPVKF